MWALASHCDISITYVLSLWTSAWSTLCRLYCVLQSFLILWGLALALDALLPCLLGDSASKASVSPMQEARVEWTMPCAIDGVSLILLLRQLQLRKG